MRVVVTLTANSLAVCGVLRSYEIINALWPKKNHSKSQGVHMVDSNNTVSIITVAAPSIITVIISIITVMISIITAEAQEVIR
jgi:hypothetical protein